MTVNELIERLQSLTDEQKNGKVAYIIDDEEYDILLDVIPNYLPNLDIPIVGLI